MADKRRTKYIVMLVIFTVLFFMSVVLCIVGYSSVSSNIRFSSAKGRLEAVEREENMYGPRDIYSTLYYDKDYEEEFDYYWEFANVYRTYIKGRFSDDPSDEIEYIQKYADSCKDKNRKELALEYIEIIKENHNR